MISFPNAKINIGLFVTEKRIDGFHNLESIFYPINWKDAIEMVRADQFKFETTGLKIDSEVESNLCVKAYRLLEQEFSLPPVHMHLHKAIPMGAGMGGGSADATFVLKNLNDLFELNLTNEQLENHARKLGSDCAFFVNNQPTYAYDKGDLFEKVPLDLSKYQILCVYPEIHVTTAQAYGGIIPKKASYNLRNISSLPIIEWKQHIHNDFENHIFDLQPTLRSIKKELYDMGALYASMSGSGSTIYGIFNKQIELTDRLNSFNCRWV